MKIVHRKEQIILRVKRGLKEDNNEKKKSVVIGTDDRRNLNKEILKDF